jgi:putative membrane protein
VQKVSEQMASTEIQGRGLSSRQAAGLAALACVLAYSLVIVTFLGALPYPPMGSATVEALAHVIAVINSLALAAILRGWWLVRRGRFAAHRRMMTTAFGLILLFLLIYLFKVGGGGIREFAGSDAIRNFIYLPMLFTHLTLSILAVPLVSYVLTLGLTRPISAVPATQHARIGRWAAGVWSTSLLLGIGAYVVLNHL